MYFPEIAAQLFPTWKTLLHISGHPGSFGVSFDLNQGVRMQSSRRRFGIKHPCLLDRVGRIFNLKSEYREIQPPQK
jgi:hypothetical protein